MIIKQTARDGKFEVQHPLPETMSVYMSNHVRGVSVDFPITPDKLAAAFGLMNVTTRQDLDGICVDVSNCKTIINPYDEWDNHLLGEYDGYSIDELNFLACEISVMNKSDRQRFVAILARQDEIEKVGDYIDLTENINCYVYIPGASSFEDVGMHHFKSRLEKAGINTANYEPFFDAGAFGALIGSDGEFDKDGYLWEMVPTETVYDGIVPVDLRVTDHALKINRDTQKMLRRKELLKECGKGLKALWALIRV